MIQRARPSQWNQTGESRGPRPESWARWAYDGRERNSSRSKISRSPADTFLSTILIVPFLPSLRATVWRVTLYVLSFLAWFSSVGIQAGFPDHGFEVSSIIIGNCVGELLDMFDGNKPHAVSDFLQAGDLKTLP
jgi:hypothetical protein